MKQILFVLAALCLLGSTEATGVCFFNNTFLATFYNGTNLTGAPIYQMWDIPSHNWAVNPVYPGASTSYISAVYEGYVVAPVTAAYTWAVNSDDGFRLYLDGNLKCSNWTVKSASVYGCSPAVAYTAGRVIKVRLEWFENLTNQVLFLLWNYGSGLVAVNGTTSNIYYQNCTQYNIVGNSTRSLDTGAGSTNLQYALSGPPNGTVTVNIASDCLLQSACSLSFNENNYATLQNVRIFPDPHSSQTCCNVTATASSDDFYNGKTFVSTVCKTTSNSSTGISWGDPHYDTFDGNVHTFLSLGDFWVLRQANGEFSIQTRQVTCSTAACNGVLAIKYKATVVYVTIDINTGTPTPTFVGDIAGSGISFVNSGSSYIYTAPTGAKAVIMVGYWNTRRVYFLDLYVTLPGFYQGQVYGLLGFFDGNKNNDFVIPNGTVYSYSQIPLFQEAWRVSSAEDLFLNSNAVIPAIFGAQPSNYSIVSCGNNPTPPGDITSNVTNSTVPPTQNQTVPFSNITFDCHVFTNATLQANAIAACAPYFNDSCCTNLGVNATPYYDVCLCDYNIAGGNDFVASDVAAYTAACNSAAAAANVSCKTCPNGCSGHGTCNNGTCACNAGWNGTDCSTDTTLCTNVTSISPTSGGRMCANSLTVYGLNFNAATLYCVFVSSSGNITVPATKVTSFQVTCTVPVALGNTAQVYVYSNGTCATTLATYTLSPFCCDGPAQSAISWGDPHFDTFDGMVYTFFDGGDFYFLRQNSGALVIQATQSTCGNAGCNVGVAVKYLGLVFYCTLTNPQVGVPVVSTNVNPLLYNVGIVNTPDLKKYIITLPTGAKITVQSLLWSLQNTYFLNILAVLPGSYKNSVFGLAGYMDGNSTNDLVDATGHVRPLSQSVSFARTWAVPTAENLFLNTNAVIPAIFGGSTPLNVAPSACANVSNSSVPTSTAPPPHNVTNTTNNFDCRNFTNATLYAAAVEACSYFNNSCCNSVGLNGTAYYLDCLCDYNVANGDSLLWSAIDSYSSQCTARAAAQNVNCNPPTAPPTDAPTPTPTSALPCAQVTSVSPPSIGLYCTGTLTITGTNFLNSVLYCIIGGYTVPASKIDNQHATCALPPVLLNDVTVYISSGTQCNSSSTTVHLTNDCCSNPSYTAITWGDPHVNTIDGNFYTTYVPPGNYYFIRQTNGDLVIQTTQVACYTAYCNSNAAVRFMGVKFFVNFTNTGTVSFYSLGNLAAAGVTVLPIGSTKYIITLPTRVIITFQVVPWASLGIWYLNVAVSLPDNYKSYVYGLGGFFDGNPANDFTGSDGVVYGSLQSQINAFCASWLVPPSEDLWVNANAVIPTIFNGGTASTIPPLTCLAPTSAPTSPPPYCPAVTDGDGVWQRGTLGAIAYGTCLTGFVGTPTRMCNSNSTYGPVLVQCVPSANSCPAVPIETPYGRASWPGTPIGDTATGTCIAGYTGSPTRKCNLDSTWSTALDVQCTQITCAADDSSNAHFNAAPAGSTVTGTCNSGFGGVIHRNCTLDGTWSAAWGSCNPTSGCVGAVYGTASFPSTAAGATSTGVCVTQFHNSPSGPPTRKCNSDSTWSPNVANSCQRNTCAGGVYSGATYGQTNSNTLANGVCVTGTGSPQRYCDLDGNWGAFRGTACV